MSDKKLHVELIGPEKPVFSGEADAISATAWDGQVGILPGHAPMVTQLGIGEVRITNSEKTGTYAIKNGYLTVTQDNIVVLSEEAKDITEIKGVDASEIEAIQKQLEETKDPEDRQRLLDDLEWLKSCDRLLKNI